MAQKSTRSLPDKDPSVMRLSPRQRQLLWGLAAGLTSAQIAKRLRVSKRTIEFHRRAAAMVLRSGGNTILLLRQAIAAEVLPVDVLGIPVPILLKRMEESHG